MLELQKHIRQHGLDSLADLGIRVYRHPSLPLVGFKYSQIDSPRNHPVVLECRGIVLEDKTWEVIAKPFDRFFNVGEYADEFATFDWENSSCVTKEDGSLIILYWYGGEWHVNTSGSFGLGEAPYYSGTWRDLFWEFSGINREDLDPFRGYTLIFELCTPYNKVVKRYENPGAYLIGINCPDTEWEAGEGYLDKIAEYMDWLRPIRFEAHGPEMVAAVIRSMENANEIIEGVVIRDSQRRWKWKTKDYLALHRLKDNGNIIRPDRLLDIVLTNEQHEVLAVMPEVKTALDQVQFQFTMVLGELMTLWDENKGAASQKEFALAIKHHKLCHLLFSLRKQFGADAGEAELLGLIRPISKKVAETIFGGQTFTFDI